MSDTVIAAPADPKIPTKVNESKEPSGKEKFIREMIAYLLSDKVTYYARGERVYIDTAPMRGRGLMLLEGPEFLSFLLTQAKDLENVLSRSADAQLIVDHVRFAALAKAVPLNEDNRAAHKGGEIIINTGWAGLDMIVLHPDRQTWDKREVAERIFEPIPPEMRMANPVPEPATSFPTILKAGIGDFGDNHCLLSVTCATMLLPATFPHPFISFVGDQARGKSTTMKLLLQLIDPYAHAELMTIGEDVRDLIALCRDRHCIALDNVTHLPFDEDLLSKMYSGGMFASRKMTTNSELSKSHLPRLRVMLNGIGTSFSRSDLLSRCIFIEHPVLTRKDSAGKDIFTPLEQVEDRWAAKLPQALGALLSATVEGWALFLEEGGLEGKTARCRYVEYTVIGECISRAMGFEPGLFTEQVYRAAEGAAETAVESDDCAQLILAWLNGESGTSQFDGFGKTEAEEIVKTVDHAMISSTELYKEIRALAVSRGNSVFSMKWLASVRSFSNAIMKSKQNIETGGWTMAKVPGGEHKRKMKFNKIKQANLTILE